MIKKVLLLLAATALTGCAVNYTLEGQKYDSKEKFQQAVDTNISNALATIKPLPAPLTRKKLIVAIPSEAIYIEEAVRRFVAMQGTQPVGPAKEILENLPKSNFKNTKVFFDAIQRKNIYTSVQFIEMQSMTGSFAASPDTDALYLIEPTQGSFQWYLVTDKQGKQIFSYDRGVPTFVGKLQAFLDAVQIQVIRD